VDALTLTRRQILRSGQARASLRENAGLTVPPDGDAELDAVAGAEVLLAAR